MAKRQNAMAEDYSISPKQFRKKAKKIIYSELQKKRLVKIIDGNKIEGVIIPAEIHTELEETIEDAGLLLQAADRLKNASNESPISFEDAIKKHGLCLEDIMESDADIS